MRWARATVMMTSLLTFGACRRGDHILATHPLLRLEQHAEGSQRVLSIVAVDGAQINARLAPVLEVDGAILRFGDATLTADSAYFVDAPRVALDTGGVVRGVLRASVCPAAHRVCLIVQLPVNGGF